MKTIAMSEHTFELLRQLKEKGRLKSFEALLRRLVLAAEGVPDSMFGVLKGKAQSFTSRDRARLWRERI